MQNLSENLRPAKFIFMSKVFGLGLLLCLNHRFVRALPRKVEMFENFEIPVYVDVGFERDTHRSTV